MFIEHVCSNLDIGGRALGGGRVQQRERRLDLVARTGLRVCSKKGACEGRFGDDQLCRRRCHRESVGKEKLIVRRCVVCVLRS